MVTDPVGLRLDGLRGRLVIDESREIVVVVDSEDRVVRASRRARETFPDLAQGRLLPRAIREGRRATEMLEVPYEFDGVTERLLYMGRPGDTHAYEELRAGFTAAVSHELRTPLARLLALLESLELPDADIPEVVELARTEIAHMGELIDDVLFLGELETGHEVVGLDATEVLPVLQEVAADAAERCAAAELTVIVSGIPGLAVAVRPRMLRVVTLNLIENAIRYAGPGTTLELEIGRHRGWIQIRARDSGAGVSAEALPRLFERFFRADTARATRGTGLGLGIVKHICVSAGGHALAEHTDPRGLTIRLLFPEPGTAGGDAGAGAA